MNSPNPRDDQRKDKHHHLRFHLPYVHLSSVFGDDWFALKAERFARFFGTPTFLVGQTIIVAVWIGINVAGLTKFDVYPFILLNLAFSLQAAYAAPLILLAQTRQADRDKVNSDADARHHEANERTYRGIDARSAYPDRAGKHKTVSALRISLQVADAVFSKFIRRQRRSSYGGG